MGMGASVLSTSLTYDDPSHTAKICAGLDLTRLQIRYKKMLFLSEDLGIELRQPIYSSRNQPIT